MMPNTVWASFLHAAKKLQKLHTCVFYLAILANEREQVISLVGFWKTGIRDNITKNQKKPHYIETKVSKMQKSTKKSKTKVEFCQISIETINVTGNFFIERGRSGNYELGKKVNISTYWYWITTLIQVTASLQSLFKSMLYITVLF